MKNKKILITVAYLFTLTTPIIKTTAMKLKKNMTHLNKTTTVIKLNLIKNENYLYQSENVTNYTNNFYTGDNPYFKAIYKYTTYPYNAPKKTQKPEIYSNKQIPKKAHLPYRKKIIKKSNNLNFIQNKNSKKQTAKKPIEKNTIYIDVTELTKKFEELTEEQKINFKNCHYLYDYYGKKDIKDNKNNLYTRDEKKQTISKSYQNSNFSNRNYTKLELNPIHEQNESTEKIKKLNKCIYEINEESFSNNILKSKDESSSKKEQYQNIENLEEDISKINNIVNKSSFVSNIVNKSSFVSNIDSIFDLLNDQKIDVCEKYKLDFTNKKNNIPNCKDKEKLFKAKHLFDNDSIYGSQENSRNDLKNILENYNENPNTKKQSQNIENSEEDKSNINDQKTIKNSPYSEPNCTARLPKSQIIEKDEKHKEFNVANKKNNIQNYKDKKEQSQNIENSEEDKSNINDQKTIKSSLYYEPNCTARLPKNQIIEKDEKHKEFNVANKKNNIPNCKDKEKLFKAKHLFDDDSIYGSQENSQNDLKNILENYNEKYKYSNKNQKTKNTQDIIHNKFSKKENINTSNNVNQNSNHTQIGYFSNIFNNIIEGTINCVKPYIEKFLDFITPDKIYINENPNTKEQSQNIENSEENKSNINDQKTIKNSLYYEPNCTARLPKSQIIEEDEEYKEFNVANKKNNIQNYKDKKELNNPKFLLEGEYRDIPKEQKIPQINLNDSLENYNEKYKYSNKNQKTKNTQDIIHNKFSKKENINTSNNVNQNSNHTQIGYFSNIFNNIIEGTINCVKPYIEKFLDLITPDKIYINENPNTKEQSQNIENSEENKSNINDQKTIKEKFYFSPNYTTIFPKSQIIEEDEEYKEFDVANKKNIILNHIPVNNTLGNPKKIKNNYTKHDNQINNNIIKI